MISVHCVNKPGYLHNAEGGIDMVT